MTTSNVPTYFKKKSKLFIESSKTKQSIHNWGTKKKCWSFERLQQTILYFCLSYIFIVVMDCCMPIDKMMSCWINKNI
jgi:hypothetical protein